MSRRRRLLLFGAAALALVELAWLLAFEWAATSGRLERWANRRPDKFTLRFQDADSWLPFHLRLEEARFAGQSPRWQWSAHANRASGWISPLPLLARRLRFEDVQANGLVVHARRRATSPEEATSLAGKVPPIDAYPHYGEEPLRPPRSTPAWSYEFPRLRGSEVNEVWIEELRFSGRLEVRGGFALRRRREAEIFPSHVRVSHGGVRLDGKPVIGRLSATLDGAIEPYPYRQDRGLAVFNHVVADAVGEGEIHDGELLRRYLRRAPWIEFDDARAPFTARARIAHGELAEGTRLEMARPRRVVSFFGFEAAGGARLIFDVMKDAEGPRANLAVIFDDYEVRRAGTDEPDVAGTGLSFLATSRDVGLAGLPTDTRIAIDLGDARVVDLRTLGALLPQGAGVEILGGGGKIEGRLAGDLATNRAEGRLSMELEGVTGRFSGLTARGKIAILAPFSSDDLASRAFDLHGSAVRFADFRLLGGGTDAPASAPDWWADVTLPRAKIDLTAPGRLSGRFAVRMRDSIPLVSFYSARKDLPGWVENLLSVPDVEATGGFRWQRGEFEITDLASAIRQTRIRARLSLARNQRQGKMLLEWKRLAVGVAIDGVGRSYRLKGARDWFAEGMPPG